MKAFLDRICFPQYKITDNFLRFERLSELEEEFEEYLIEAEDEAEVEQPRRQIGMCGTCLERPAECALIPCGHRYFCMVCFDEWKNRNPGAYENIDPDFNIVDSGNASRVSIPPRCPICRDDIVGGLKVIDS